MDYISLLVTRHRRHLMYIGTALAVLFAIVAYGHVVRADDAAGKSDEHIITLHDNGEDKGFITKKSTLREALAEANIRLDAHDRTEPALDEQLVAKSYQVNIYRARPVLVRDGASETKLVSSYRTGKQIAEQAGVALQSEDLAILTPSTDPIGDGAAEIINIDRATPFTFAFYGKTEQSFTRARTIRAMLAEKHITMLAADGIDQSLDAPMVAGMTVKLWRNGVQTVTVDEDVAYTTKQIKDADRDPSYKQVQTPGQPGRRTVTYEINTQNGREIARKEVNSNVTKQPVEQVEVVGSKSRITPYTGGGSKSEWLAASGIPSQYWGAADAIVSQESGWNPNSTNRSSGACGLAQALPCSKVPGNPYDPVDSLRWMNSYVQGRYGGWEQALAFKRSHGWY